MKFPAKIRTKITIKIPPQFPLKFRQIVRSASILPCALIVGLLPILAALIFAALWQGLPLLPDLDLRSVFWLLSALSPFAAGFARLYQTPTADDFTLGVLPAFLLWLAGILIFRQAFPLPTPKILLISLLIALLLGIAGAMSAKRIANFCQKKKAEANSPAENSV